MRKLKVGKLLSFAKITASQSMDINPNNPSTIARLRLYEAIASIPEGKVASYGQLAALVDRQGAARWVGYCLRHLPKDSTLPWHRVITASGKLAFAPNTEAYWRQRNKLEEEGISINQHKVKMAVYQWRTS